MFDTTDKILNQIRAGEDSGAEFKEVRLGDRVCVLSPGTESLAAELVAFANADGGVVFIGVDDSGAVTGIPSERLDQVERWIVDIATNNCEPPIRPNLRKVLIPVDSGSAQHVLLAEVSRGLYVHRTSGGRYFVRVGSTKRNLTPRELARLFEQRCRNYVFDEHAVLSASVNDLNRYRLEAYFGRSPTIPWLDLLRNTRVTFRDENSVDRPTVAGLLTFLITEDSQPHLGAGNVLDSGFDPVDLNRCGMYNKYLITKEFYMPKNHVQFQKGQSLRDFLKLYGTELQCAQAVFQARWPQGFRCPACG